MKRITFIRHAKSDWGHEFLKDADRPLNERGYGDAYLQSAWYAAHHEKPDLVLSSPAVRALSTALIFTREMNLGAERVTLVPKIYEAPADTLLDMVRSLPPTAKQVMLFGHNPGFTNICNYLSNSYFFDNLPTCGIVALNFAGLTWSEVAEKTGELHFYRFPKDFKQTRPS